MDRVLEKLEEVCGQEETQRRIQANLLDPAATYIARKLFKYTACFTALMLLQICLLFLLLVPAYRVKITPT